MCCLSELVYFFLLCLYGIICLVNLKYLFRTLVILNMKWLLILIPQKMRESQFQHIRAGKQQNYVAYSFFTVVVKAPWWLTLSCAKKNNKSTEDCHGQCFRLWNAGEKIYTECYIPSRLVNIMYRSRYY